jgi:hypothetical protein
MFGRIEFEIDAGGEGLRNPVRAGIARHRNQIDADKIL